MAQREVMEVKEQHSWEIKNVDIYVMIIEVSTHTFQFISKLSYVHILTNSM